MASRYAHDETYTLRLRALHPASSSNANATATGTKWKALGAIAGAAISAGALSVALLNSSGAPTTVNLEAKHVQLRGSHAQASIEVPFSAFDHDGDGLVGENELSEAAALAFMQQETELRANTSLSEEELEAHVRGVRANYQALVECLRDSLMESTSGESVVAVSPGTFEAFRSIVRGKCPDAATVVFPQGAPTPTFGIQNSAVAATSSLPFGDVDMNRDGVVTADDLMMYMAPHFHALEDEIQGDTALSDAVKDTKIDIVRGAFQQKFECWTRVFKQMVSNQEPKHLVAGTFDAFAEAVAHECPDAAFESHTDPLALADAPLPQSETKAEQTRDFENEVENSSISFMDLDANRDQVLESQELETFLSNFFASVITQIKGDRSLSSEIMNVKLQIVQDQHEQQSRCLKRAVAQMAKDGVAITPATYPILETLMADGCAIQTEDEVIQAAVASGEQPTMSQPLLIGGPGPVVLTEAPTSEGVVPGQPIEAPQEEHHVESVVTGREVVPEITSISEGSGSPRGIVDLPSLPGRVESDPQPAQPEQAVDGNEEGAKELKQMLLDEFGLSEPEGGEAQMPSTEAPSKEDVDDAKKELKEALLGSLVVSEVNSHDEPPPADVAGDDKEQQEEAIKEALMDAFLPKNNVPVVEDAIVPVAPNEGETTEEALKAALLGALAPPDQPNPIAIDPIGAQTTIMVDGGSWNWLHPSVTTYGLVKDSDRDAVSVPNVFQHLQQEREARSQPLLAALMKTEADYKHTLECFTKGVNTLSKANVDLTQEKYAHIVQWMNDKCEAATVDEEEVKEEEAEGDNKRKYMTKPEFKALIAKHFQPLLDDFHLGQLTAEQMATHAGRVRTKLFNCVEQAVENAVDATAGTVHEKELVPALDWVVNVCAEMP